jgi:hypothetical protein
MGIYVEIIDINIVDGLYVYVFQTHPPGSNA